MMPGPTEGDRGKVLTSDHKLALEALLAFDPEVRCVIETRFSGEQIASVKRKGLESLEPESETVRVLDQTALGAGMGFSMNGYHGRVRVVIVARGRLSLIIFPLYDSLVLVSTDPEFPLQKTRRMAELLDTTFPDNLGVNELATAPRNSPNNVTFRGHFL
jgi:hypothetical protein